MADEFDAFEKAVRQEAREQAQKGAPVAEKDAEASEAAAIGLTKEELAEVKAAQLKLWPLGQ